MKVTPSAVPDALIIEPKVIGDTRGYFLETWQQERYARHGIPTEFVQDNLASSTKGVLRGLHLQYPYGQGKLVQVLSGRVFDVAVDVRRGSPWFGRWAGVLLDGESKLQFWVPDGFAHGYYVMSDVAVFAYKCTELYHPETELSLLWNDPRVGIEWPLDGEPRLSDKDRTGLLLQDVETERLPGYED